MRHLHRARVFLIAALGFVMAAPAVAQTADDQCKPLPVLAAPTVTVNGKTDGNQNFSYVVVAHFPNGSAAASPPGSVKNGSDVSAADFPQLRLLWTAAPSNPDQTSLPEGH